jgi:hypothetical protein
MPLLRQLENHRDFIAIDMALLAELENIFHPGATILSS